MISSQILARGVREASVLRAIRLVPRELFVPVELKARAYDDCPLPIGPGQTISQPYIVAYMTEQLKLQSDCAVLEVGTGTGYQAAILGHLARVVHTIESDQVLSDKARDRLGKLGFGNVFCYSGDGSAGLESAAPFDRIMITAGAPAIPAKLVDQLSLEGMMVIPVGDTVSQTLIRVEKRKSGTVEIPLIPCRFVKMVGEYGWSI